VRRGRVTTAALAVIAAAGCSSSGSPTPALTRLQSSPAGRQRIAAAVAAGILAFVGE
jgi:hypothetical protein